MFAEAERDEVRARLLARARADDDVSAAALTGSAARGTEDRWSDVDLLLAVAPGRLLAEVLGAWSEFVYGELGALHHFDLRSGSAVYRAFLLGDGLEVDLGFTPAAEFGQVGDGGFRVVFGAAVEPRPTAGDARGFVGYAWHHVLHARAAIERDAPWLAEYWISGVRDQTLALACLRLGLPTGYAKGADRLPAAVTRPLEEALVRGLGAAELRRALAAATGALLDELRATDEGLTERLAGPLRAATASSDGDRG
ncbi:nucleotidyltransferase domain-containing protein [Streptomyces sp. NPDC127098]|uniref:nucleotidyltransferase domain-containing protein n=1 Tax=Streptomyces sp. NPDC127098 TaxID=3347137 RepID=UPI00365A7F1E